MNNKLPQLNFIFDRRKKASLTTKASVELMISYDYKQRFISTGVMLYSNQWKRGKIVNCPDIMQISSTLDSLLIKVRQIILDMDKEGFIDITEIPNRLNQLRAEQINFIEYCHERFKIRKFGKAPRSIDRYNLFLKVLKEWGVLQHFRDVTELNLIAFDKYLADRNLSSYTKWHNYHRHLNSMILDAIKDGLLSRNPYNNIYIDKGREDVNIDNCLTPEEFKKLKSASMPTPCLERVRDLFIFQTYTCLRYSDLEKFDAALIREMGNMKVYIRAAKKTKKPFVVPMLQPALDILEKYNNSLPVISNPKYNLFLKVVAQAAGLDKPLTTHWARHTGSTLLLNNGLDIKYITKICGHSSTRITEQVYAKLLNETVVEAVEEIKDKLE